MNDPLKGFVERHRDEFDHLEAPQFDLAGLKAKMAQNPIEKKHLLSAIKLRQWMVAASILMAFAAGLWFLKVQDHAQDTASNITIKKNTKPKKALAPPVVKAADLEREHQVVAAPVKKRRLKKEVRPIGQFNKSLDQQLNDSTSASTRLAAILTLKEGGLMSYELLDRLAVTIQQDGNSNVRLAALSVLEKYQQDEHVSNLLIASFNHQNDPTVQLALINLLGNMHHIEIEEKLYALVNNPLTFEAVKDEAYHILLKENKL